MVKDILLVTLTASVTATSTVLIQNSNSKETLSKTDSILQNPDAVAFHSLSEDYEELSKFRYASSNKTNKKLLLSWKDLEPWIKKVQENVTNKELWPSDILFLKNRTNTYFAKLLRQKCYLSSYFLSRVHSSDNQSSDSISKLFANVNGSYNPYTLNTLCASNENLSQEIFSKYANSTWRKLENYENFNNYFVDTAGENKNELAKKYYEEKKKEVPDVSFEDAMKSYSVYLVKKSGEPDKYATKEDFGKLYTKLEDIPMLKGVVKIIR